MNEILRLGLGLGLDRYSGLNGYDGYEYIEDMQIVLYFKAFYIKEFKSCEIWRLGIVRGLKSENEGGGVFYSMDIYGYLYIYIYIYIYVW